MPVACAQGMKVKVGVFCARYRLSQALTSLFSHHHHHRVTVLLFTILAFCFSLVTIASCEFFSYTTRGSGKAGLFFLQDPDTLQCVDYGISNSLLQPVVLGARTCAVLAAIFGFLALLFVCIEFCCCNFCCARFLETMIYLAAWLSQALTFLVFANQSYWYVC